MKQISSRGVAWEALAVVPYLLKNALLECIFSFLWFIDAILRTFRVVFDARVVLCSPFWDGTSYGKASLHIT